MQAVYIHVCMSSWTVERCVCVRVCVRAGDLSTLGWCRVTGCGTWWSGMSDAQLCLCISSSSLPTDQGLDLMERLAQRLNLRLTDLQQLSYVPHTHTHTCKDTHTHSTHKHTHSQTYTGMHTHVILLVSNKTVVNHLTILATSKPCL